MKHVQNKLCYSSTATPKWLGVSCTSVVWYWTNWRVQSSLDTFPNPSSIMMVEWVLLIWKRALFYWAQKYSKTQPYNCKVAKLICVKRNLGYLGSVSHKKKIVITGVMMSKSLRTMEFTADRTGFTRQTQISSTKQLCGSRPGKSSPLTFTGVSGDGFLCPTQTVLLVSGTLLSRSHFSWY